MGRMGEHRQFGFSLLEVMVAATILVVLMVGLWDSMLGSIQNSRAQEDSVIAHKAAHQALETALAMEYDD
ncbi:MAG: type II secretion system protein, partial [Planctomycetota bacterium]